MKEKNDYVNPGQKPFTVPDYMVSNENRKKLRTENKKYYNLGMPKVKKAVRCEKCGRPKTLDHNCYVSETKILSEQIECPKCKTLILKDAKYCYSCKVWNTENDYKK